MCKGYCLVVINEQSNSITEADDLCKIGLFPNLQCEKCNNWVQIEDFFPDEMIVYE